MWTRAPLSDEWTCSTLCSCYAQPESSRQWRASSVEGSPDDLGSARRRLSTLPVLREWYCRQGLLLTRRSSSVDTMNMQIGGERCVKKLWTMLFRAQNTCPFMSMSQDCSRCLACRLSVNWTQTLMLQGCSSLRGHCPRFQQKHQELLGQEAASRSPAHLAMCAPSCAAPVQTGWWHDELHCLQASFL